MALFNEIDPNTFSGGQIIGIEPGSVAAALGLRPGDELLAINDQAVEDIIDVQFYAAEEELELLVRRYDGSPVVQVIRVYTRRADGRYELDYWCDICSIPMYELKPCECCQGETRLRERKVDTAGNVLDGE